MMSFNVKAKNAKGGKKKDEGSMDSELDGFVTHQRVVEKMLLYHE